MKSNVRGKTVVIPKSREYDLTDIHVFIISTFYSVLNMAINH